MADAMKDREEMTCGEFLDGQRRLLAGVGDLSAPGAARKAEECLANIYAVCYQMNFERREPPSPNRGPAEHEALDRELVAEVADGLRHKARAFDGITDDPRRLSQAVNCAGKGNGFSLIEMVNTAFLAGRMQTGQKNEPEVNPKAEKHPAPAGPAL